MRFWRRTQITKRRRSLSRRSRTRLGRCDVIRPNYFIRTPLDLTDQNIIDSKLSVCFILLSLGRRSERDLCWVVIPTSRNQLYQDFSEKQFSHRLIHHGPSGSWSKIDSKFASFIFALLTQCFIPPEISYFFFFFAQTTKLIQF